MAGLVLMGAAGAGLPDRANAAASPGELLVYYGWPSRINGAADTTAAAAELGRYDFVALGSGVENPSHPDHAPTRLILADPAMAGTFVFGYVSLGVTGASLPMDEVQRRIENWSLIGADGILFDEYGYDFGTSRERQNAAVDYAHQVGMPVLANAWFPADAFDAAAHPDYNPAGLPARLGPGDYYLSESYRVMMGQYVPEDLWRAKAEELAVYRARIGFSILSITTNDPGDAYVEEMFFAAWNAAAADGHLATGWGEYLFSADDGLAPYRARPAAPDAFADPDPPVGPPGGGILPPPEETGGGDAGNRPPAPVVCAGRPATIVGTPGDDHLVGTEGPDVIAGLGGNDVIEGLGGDDTICGGGGEDVISGGPGDDRLLGGAGSDRLSGDEGSDLLQGGGGNDHLSGGPGDDRLQGNGGDDLLEGGEGNDRLLGGPGADRMLGGPGDDVLRGQRGDDHLEGGDGFDRVRGGPGVDTCNAERAFSCEA